jgi:hypothetical protein
MRLLVVGQAVVVEGAKRPKPMKRDVIVIRPYSHAFTSLLFGAPS